MPRTRSHDLSLRRRSGIVGPNTRQRDALIRHPLSLHLISEVPRDSSGSLPLPRARNKLAARTRCSHVSTSLLSGTV
jgi:hypothetical protein